MSPGKFRSRWLSPGVLLPLLLSSAVATSAVAQPDLTGVWMAQPESQFSGKLLPPPVLRPEAERALKRRAEARQRGYVRDVASMLCQNIGGPSMFQYNAPFEVLSGPGRIVLVFENESNNQPRTIFLNRKAHPDDVFPSYNGDSIGHWEGDVLVVDTIGFNGRSSHHTNWLGGVPHSDAAHFIERFSLSKDGKVLTDQITQIDPKILAKPWTTTLKFDRQPDDTALVQVDCEVDLDALKSLDLNALKDADPEVARLLEDGADKNDPAAKAHEEKK